MAIERHWRSRDKLSTSGLRAMTKGVRGFEWEGMEIDAMPTFLAEIVAQEYTDLRAVFFFFATTVKSRRGRTICEETRGHGLGLSVRRDETRRLGVS